jgi:hypothetical protein
MATMAPFPGIPHLLSLDTSQLNPHSREQLLFAWNFTFMAFGEERQSFEVTARHCGNRLIFYLREVYMKRKLVEKSVLSPRLKYPFGGRGRANTLVDILRLSDIRK